MKLFKQPKISRIHLHPTVARMIPVGERPYKFDVPIEMAMGINAEHFISYSESDRHDTGKDANYIVVTNYPLDKVEADVRLADAAMRAN